MGPSVVLDGLKLIINFHVTVMEREICPVELNVIGIEE